jgi:hypothetical protein
MHISKFVKLIVYLILLTKLILFLRGKVEEAAYDVFNLYPHFYPEASYSGDKNLFNY